jgi:hypothetical protein
MSAQIEMNTSVTEPIVESQGKVKQKNFISKREGLDHLVFGYWFIHQLELDDVTKAKAMNKLRLFDGYEIQNEFMGCFMDDYKTIEKEVTKNINNHFKPSKEKKEKKIIDGEKPKRGRPKVEKKDTRSEQEKLVDQIIKASQTEPPQLLAEPKVEVVEPKVEVVEPKVEVAEPKVEVVEPKVEVAEPKVEVAEPKVEVAEPKVEVAEPKVEVAEPKVEVVKTQVKTKKQTVPKKPKKEKKTKFIEPIVPINLNDSFELVEESYEITNEEKNE